MTKSCSDCLSCVPADEVPVLFKKATEADVCYQHGHILSRPGQTDSENERIKIAFAEKCPNYGMPRAPIKPEFIAAQVAVGDLAVISKMQSMVVDPSDKPSSCAGCQHFVGPLAVKRDLGWTLGMCAAKGRLLFAGALVREAAGCGVGLKGAPRDTTDGIQMLPMYDSFSGFAPVNMGGGRAVVSPERHKIDPREYVTDKDVTPEDEANFIRAWRQCDDPEGLRDPVFLPIFDGERLCGFDPRTTYGKHRPDLFVDHQGLLYDFTVEMFDMDEPETPLLIGSAGTGKTEAGCWMAWLMDLPFTRLSVKKETEARDFVGESKLITDPVTGTPITFFKDGRLVTGITRPGVVMIDEPNLQASIFELLRPLFDSAKQMVVDEDQGTVITVNPYCFIMASQNPAWDPIYVGTEPMSAADLDRVTPVYLGLPSENIEREIIKTHMRDGHYDIPTKTLDKIMQIADHLRRLILDGALPIAWGLRAQIKVARKTKYYSLEKAYRRALVDGMEPEQVSTIMGVVRGVA